MPRKPRIEATKWGKKGSSIEGQIIAAHNEKRAKELFQKGLESFGITVAEL